MIAVNQSPRRIPTADIRNQIIDALYRFGAGQDLRDRALFESAFAPEATLDFTQPAQRFGATLPIFQSRCGIADAVFQAIDALDTTHSMTNPRVTAYDGKQAALFALVEAQHLPRGDHRRHLLLKNIFMLQLSEHAGDWLIDCMKINNVWFPGDPAVLFREQNA